MTAQQLKDYRKEKGWDQAAAAEKIGVSIHTVRSWEQGKNPIPVAVEKLLLSEIEAKPSLDVILEIHQLASELGESFQDVLFKVMRTGIKEVKNASTQPPTSKKRGAKSE